MITNLYKRTIAIILAAMFLICIPFIAIADDNNGDDSKLPKWVTNFIEYYDLGQDKINYTKKLEYDDGRTVWTGTDSAGNKVTLIYDPDQNQMGVYQQTNKEQTTLKNFTTFWQEVDNGYTAHRTFGVVIPGTTDLAGNKGNDTRDNSQQGFTYKFYDQECWFHHISNGSTLWHSWPYDSVYTEVSYDPETGRKSESKEYQSKDNIETNLAEYGADYIIFNNLDSHDPLSPPEYVLDESVLGNKRVGGILPDSVSLFLVGGDDAPEDSSEHKAKIGTKRAWTTNSNGALESETITTKNGQTYSYKTDVTNDNANGAGATQTMKITMGNMEIDYDKSDGHRTKIKYTNKYGSEIELSFDKNGKVTGVKRDNSETNSQGTKYTEIFFGTHDEYGVPFDNASASTDVTFYDENEFYTEMAADVVYADATGYLMSGAVKPAAKKALADGTYGYFEISDNPDSDLLNEMDEKINNNPWHPKNTGTEKYKSGKAFNDRLFSRLELFKVTKLVLGHVFNIKEIIGKFLAGALWVAQTK